ncbi:MAG: phytoene desaturase family protein [Candidatus Altimarinota bacterium]
MKKIIVIGAGPGGLASAMILASKGYDVTVYEKQANVGGRNSLLQLGEYKFDLGPTFLMYLPALQDVFAKSGKKVEDYLNILQLDPLYKLSYDSGKEFHPRAKTEDTIKELEKVFPNDAKNYEKYIQKEGEKFDALLPCFQKPYGKFTDLLHPSFLKTIPKLDLLKSLLGRLETYFSDEDLRIAMTFQSKYLGMSPRRCPASFTILSYLEHKMGIYHVEGGLNKISEAMAKVVQEYNGKIHFNTPVKKIIVENGVAVGVELENGEKDFSDALILNGDFSYSMRHLLDNSERKRYTDKKIDKKGFSCSTILFYLGLDTIYENLNHHNIVFNKNYKNFVEKISDYQDISDDFSFYVHNPSVLDKTLAPEGHSSLYILVPTPNNRSEINWEDKKEKMLEQIFATLEKRFGITDIKQHIKQKHIITPNDWEADYNVHLGAVFNLSHNIGQMLYFRPHNEFEDVKNMYIVGGGTHPGSGLPTIYESGIISAMIIDKK